MSTNFCSKSDSRSIPKKLPKEALDTYSTYTEEKPNEAEDTARLLQLIEEFRAETAPFSYSLAEPNIPSKEYQQIRTLQKEVLELTKLGKNQEGYTRAREMLELVTDYYPKAHPVALSAYNNVAIFLRRSSQLAQAKSILITVYEGYTRVLGPAHQHSLLSLSNLAAVYKTNGEIDTAKKLYSEAIERAGRNEDISASLKTNLRWGLASCLRDLGHLTDSISLLNEALVELGKTSKESVTESLLKAQLLQAKGLACKRMKKYLEAENLYLEVLRIREGLLNNSHPEVLAVCHNLAELYNEMKNEEKAAEYHARVLQVLKEDRSH